MLLAFLPRFCSQISVLTRNVSEEQAEEIAEKAMKCVDHYVGLAGSDDWMIISEILLLFVGLALWRATNQVIFSWLVGV